MKQRWQADSLSNIPCAWLGDLFTQGKVHEYEDFPSVQNVNRWAKQLHANFNYQFIEQSEQASDIYYENQIAINKQIPTRKDNWHDFMNAMIWLQFPKSKALISELHAKDIADFGLSPRTPRRDRLTQFDECGLLLLVEEANLLSCEAFFFALATHQWQRLFIDYAAHWHKLVQPCLFGHASAEILMAPFHGVTAKWLVVAVADGFKHLTKTEQRQHLDSRLSQVIKHYDGFTSKNVLRPLPVLGIPAWYDKQTPEFYADVSQFRPQRPGVSLCLQCPPRWPLKY